eukprot:TRINITY_DN16831_c0_g1_i1.p1 TRINITY_DN16831_c0_g1~~TRINITY_DN16831_c0_g1_i1.p1  ORF type:complete len:240 (-),score=60.98 TRINITY_DN16831_c0_g1_i1:186-905(-)
MGDGSGDGAGGSDCVENGRAGTDGECGDSVRAATDGAGCSIRARTEGGGGWGDDGAAGDDGSGGGGGGPLGPHTAANAAFRASTLARSSSAAVGGAARRRGSGCAAARGREDACVGSGVECVFRDAGYAGRDAGCVGRAGPSPDSAPASRTFQATVGVCGRELDGSGAAVEGRSVVAEPEQDAVSVSGCHDGAASDATAASILRCGAEPTRAPAPQYHSHLRHKVSGVGAGEQRRRRGC